MFSCDCCGKCCMNLGESELYRDLDRGDGVCLHFDLKSHLCRIYAKRPDKCNVDKSYNLFFRDIMSKEQYYQLNYKACMKLKGGR